MPAFSEGIAIETIATPMYLLLGLPPPDHCSSFVTMDQLVLCESERHDFVLQAHN